MKLIYIFLCFCAIFIKSQYYVGVDKIFKNSFLSTQNLDNSYHAVSPDGSLFVAKSGSICKFLQNGELDMSFGISGCISGLNNNTGSALNIYFQNQNLYFSAGNKISKYDINGNLDISFGSNGTITVTSVILMSASNEILKVNDDGSLLVNFGYYGGIVKVLQNGDVDSSFPLIRGDKAYLSNDKIFIRSLYYKTIKKYDLNGNMTVDFGGQGELGIDSDKLWVVSHITEDIYICGGTSITKYKSNGLIDTTFGTNGVSNIILPQSSINQIDIDSNNKILIFGGVLKLYAGDSLVGRVNPDGSYDTSFNNGSHFCYLTGNNTIISAKLLNNNKYFCVTYIRNTMSTYKTGVTQILRTENLQELSNREAKSEGRITISPNPVKDIFTIHLDKKEKIISVKLFDNTGRLILNTSSVANNINHLNKGIYFLEVKTSGSSYTRKIIKE